MKNKWIPTSTPPKEFQEVILYREDAGVFTGFYGNYAECLPESEVEKLSEKLSEDELFEIRWFCFYLDGVDSLEFDTLPTHWMPLPEEPKI